MEFRTVVRDTWILPASRFDDEEFIEKRVALVEEAQRPTLRRALRYLYMTDGAMNLQRNHMLAAVPLLEAREKRAIRWIYTRTNGSERKNYGPQSVVAMRKARFRCERCGFPDVRSLQVDHKTGRVTRPFVFQCLCANCHSVETYDRTQTSKPATVEVTDETDRAAIAARLASLDPAREGETNLEFYERIICGPQGHHHTPDALTECLLDTLVKLRTGTFQLPHSSG